MLDAVEFELDGKQYEVRPTFGAIVKIEERIGKPLLKLVPVTAGTDEDMKVFKATDVAIVIHEALKANGHNMSFQEVGELIMKSGGFIAYVTVVVEFIMKALTAGPEKPAPLSAGESKS